MASTPNIESAILRLLDDRGSCTLDELTRKLSSFTLNQVLFAVDRLSRADKLIIRHPTCFEYLVSRALASSKPNRHTGNQIGTGG